MDLLYNLEKFNVLRDSSNSLYLESKEKKMYGFQHLALIYSLIAQSKIDNARLKDLVKIIEEYIETEQSPVKELIYSALGDFYSSERAGLIKSTNRQLRYNLSFNSSYPNYKNDEEELKSQVDYNKAENFYLKSIQNANIDTIDLKYFAGILSGRDDSTGIKSIRSFLIEKVIEFYQKQARFKSADSKNTNGISYTSIEIQNLKDSLYNEKVRIQEKLNNPYGVIREEIEFINREANMDVDNRINKFLLLLERYKGQKEEVILLTELAELYNRSIPRSKENLNSNNNRYLENCDSICQLIIQKYPNTNFAEIAKAIIVEIHESDFEILTDAVIPSNQKLELKIQYRNTSQLFLKLYKISRDEFISLKRIGWNGQYNKASESLLFKSYKFIPLNINNRIYNNEIIVLDSLEIGNYVMYISDRENNVKGSCEKSIKFQVSNLACFIIQNEDQTDKLIVVNRKDGSPIKGVIGMITYSNQDDRNYENELITKVTLKSDEKGIMYLFDHGNASLKLQFNGDTLISEEKLYSSRKDLNSEEEEYRVIFYVDKPIYRPTQEVFFKAILLKFDKYKIPSIVPNTKIIVTSSINDGNEENKLLLTTNNFGTTSGKFVIPKNYSLASFNIYAEEDEENETLIDGQLEVPVSDYSSPDFNLSIDSIYKIDQTNIYRIRGKATHANGAPYIRSRVKINIQIVNKEKHPIEIEFVNQLRTIDSLITNDDGYYSYNFQIPNEYFSFENDFKLDLRINVIVHESLETSGYLSKLVSLSKISTFITHNINKIYEKGANKALQLFFKDGS